MHFYNVPVDGNVTSPFSPLSIIRRVHEPGAFIVVKLDIDNEVIFVGTRRKAPLCCWPLRPQQPAAVLAIIRILVMRLRP